VRKTVARRSLTALIWAMTVGVVAFYLSQLWQIRRGIFAARCAPAAAREPDRWPHVTIVVPARNEQRNIRRCVISLLAQDYPRFDVIAVDDASTDQTRAILEELRHGPHGDRLTVVDAGPLPPGWAGKPHAMAAGAAQARGEWLLFTDADTTHRPGALRFAITEGLQRQADLVTLLTGQEYVDWSNHVIMPVIFMGIMALYPPARIANPRADIALANGQYLLIRRAMYDAVGGYAGPALRNSLIDDRDLAMLVKRQGGQLVGLDGRAQVSVLMYRSLGEAMRGWGKNAYAGSKGGLPLFLAFVIALPLGTVAPFLLWLAGLITRRRWLLAASGAQIAAILAYRWEMEPQMRHSRWWGLTHPLGGALVTAVLGQSLWRQATRRGVEWSGRRYLVTQGDTAASHRVDPQQSHAAR
jgi:chlorobactene glucosyltransferase